MLLVHLYFVKPIFCNPAQQLLPHYCQGKDINNLISNQQQIQGILFRVRGTFKSTPQKIRQLLQSVDCSFKILH